jgi:hypothetical protein
LEHRATIVGIALLFASVASEALTLGNIRGAALIGQPLDMAVQIRMDEGQDLASLCFEAEVFHAETRQEASHVKVQVEATAMPDMAQVRITSSAIVDEPIVTLYLRSSCGQKTSRRYVVLADFPGDSAPAPVPLVAAAPALVRPQASPGAALALQQPAAALPEASVALAPPRPLEPKKKATSAKATKKRASAPAPELAPTTPAKSETKPAAKEAKPARSQLKLDAADLKAVVKPPVLPVLPVLEAPKPLVPSEETLLSLQKIQALDGELKALRASASKTQASLAELTARLQKSESENFSSVWVYSLIALLVASLSALAWLWSQQRRFTSNNGGWWSGPQPLSHEDRVRATRFAPGPSVAPESEFGVEVEEAPAPAATPAAPVAIPVDLADEASVREAELAVAKAWLPLHQPAPADVRTRSADFAKPLEYPAAGFEPTMVADSSAGLDFDNLHEAPAAPTAGPVDFTKLRAHPEKVNGPSPEAISDIRQLAKNFVAMGQVEPALEVLQAQIDHSEHASPELYHDLLAILHGAGDRAGFNRYRDEFNQRFPDTVAEFDLFTA